MIGFGQNADQFSVLTSQQAIVLDPNNPQQYVNLGGIYYQLQLWDDAARQFQVALGLKQDYANAYYNLGHALEAKGDLNQAYAAYQVVKSLVAKDPANDKAITAEIDALKQKAANLQAQAQQQQVAGAQTAPTPTPDAASSEQGPLKVDKPTTQLPERNPKAKIPGPTISPIPSTASPVPTKAAN
jgi:tetratricopeptide (TPR) repeat protein